MSNPEPGQSFKSSPGSSTSPEFKAKAKVKAKLPTDGRLYRDTKTECVYSWHEVSPYDMGYTEKGTFRGYELQLHALDAEIWHWTKGSTGSRPLCSIFLHSGPRCCAGCPLALTEAVGPHCAGLDLKDVENTLYVVENTLQRIGERAMSCTECGGDGVLEVATGIPLVQCQHPDEAYYLVPCNACDTTGYRGGPPDADAWALVLDTRKRT